MTDRGIIFSAPMILAMRQKRKIQTRRLATSPLRRCEPGDRLWARESCAAEELSRPPAMRKANARERQHLHRTQVLACDELDGADGIRYLADDAWTIIENTPEAGEAWSVMFHYHCKGAERPSGRRGKTVPAIHMPRWASRMTLLVDEVRFQPLRAITEHDARCEGVERCLDDPARWRDYSRTDGQSVLISPRESYATLWDTLHPEGERWRDNPDVVAITYRVKLSNIDRLK